MKNASAHILKASLLAALLGFAGLGAAQPAGAGDVPHTPPPEALAACKSIAAGQACSFTSPRGAVSGTCWAPAGKPLACKPKNAPGGGAAPAKK